MGYSKLVEKFMPAHSNNYQKGRSGYKICKITPHHMAGKLTAKRCGELFQNPKRYASSNYGIGYDGEIYCYVDEDNRAYTSSNKANDCQAITIEVANSKTGGDWPISEASWNSLVNLCVDICRRHGFRLEYTNNPNGSLTRHNMFAATSCPGPYLQGRFSELAKVVNSRLDNDQPEPVPEVKTNYLVKVTTSVLNIREDAGTNYEVVGQIKDKGTYTIIAEKDGQGASKWGKLKSGQGWISLDFVEKQKALYYPKCTSTQTGLSAALKSIKVNNSFAFRRKIAKANGIKVYLGTAKQNTDLLKLLKAGKLKRV